MNPTLKNLAARVTAKVIITGGVRDMERMMGMIPALTLQAG